MNAPSHPRTSSGRGSRSTTRSSDGLWIKIAKKGTGVQSRRRHRDARRRAVLRLDRRPAQVVRRDLLPAEVHAAAGALEVVQAQRRAGGEADRERARCSRPGFAEIERAKADGRWDAAYDSPREHPGAARPAGRARRAPGGGGVLRDAQLDQPLLDPLSPARRQAARDAGAAAGAVRRDARARRDALLARMRLLVTGGAGYIGSIVAQQLRRARRRRHRARLALPRPPRRRARGRGVRRGRPAGPRRARRRARGAASTASCTSPRCRWSRESVEHPERYWRGNVVGALNLLDAMRARGRAAARVLLDRRDLRRARRST